MFRRVGDAGGTPQSAPTDKTKSLELKNLAKEVKTLIKEARKSGRGLLPENDTDISNALARGLTYHDLGTSAEEVTQLQFQFRKSLAKNGLERALKSPQGMSAMERDHLFSWLAKDMGISVDTLYQQLGTSSAQIDTLIAKNEGSGGETSTIASDH